MVKKDKDGNVTSTEVTVSKEDAESGGVELPIEGVEPAADAGRAPEVEVKVPSSVTADNPVRVTVPVAGDDGDGPDYGIVVFAVDDEGNETLLPKSYVDADGDAVFEVSGDVATGELRPGAGATRAQVGRPCSCALSPACTSRGRSAVFARSPECGSIARGARWRRRAPRFSRPNIRPNPPHANRPCITGAPRRHVPPNPLSLDTIGGAVRARKGTHGKRFENMALR